MTQINKRDKDTEPATQKGHNACPQLSHGQRQMLEYLQSITRELSFLAKGDRAYRIGYMLDMAYIEISDVLRGEQPISAGFMEGQLNDYICHIPAPLRK